MITMISAATMMTTMIVTIHLLNNQRSVASCVAIYALTYILSTKFLFVRVLCLVALAVDTKKKH